MAMVILATPLVLGPHKVMFTEAVKTFVVYWLTPSPSYLLPLITPRSTTAKDLLYA